jgi:hypothetical protein
MSPRLCGGPVRSSSPTASLARQDTDRDSNFSARATHERNWRSSSWFCCWTGVAEAAFGSAVKAQASKVVAKAAVRIFEWIVWL